MRSLAVVAVLMMSGVGWCVAQSNDIAPVTVQSFAWRRAKQPAQRTKSGTVNPAREITVEDTAFARRLRESQQRGSMPDPSDETPDGRRAKLDKIQEDAATPASADVDGFSYHAIFKNNTKLEASIVYWEYVFTEIAKPTNVVRRQFLCAANIKPGDKKELSVFSILAPSEVISSASLAQPDAKLFKEVVYVNRVEFSDESVIQRREWKFEEVKKAVARAVSTPWSTEVCRAL